LHAIKAGALPHKVNTEIMVHINGDPLPYTSREKPSKSAFFWHLLVLNKTKSAALLMKLFTKKSLQNPNNCFELICKLAFESKK
jgi:hypothetical protein